MPREQEMIEGEKILKLVLGGNIPFPIARALAEMNEGAGRDEKNR